MDFVRALRDTLDCTLPSPAAAMCTADIKGNFMDT